MAYITTSDLEVALCKVAGSLASDPKALLAISAAEQAAWKMTCLNFDATGIATVPTPLIGADPSCLTGITAGKWQVYTYTKGEQTVTVDPFTTLRNVVVVPRGLDYINPTNCTSVKKFTLRDIQLAWRYGLKPSHMALTDTCYYNQLSFCETDCIYCNSSCGPLGCTELWVQAEWAGLNEKPACKLPGDLTMALTGYAAELYSMYCCGKASIKSESVEGYSVTFKDSNETLNAYMNMIKSYAVCSSI